jgi:hypothetical protein
MTPESTFGAPASVRWSNVTDAYGSSTAVSKPGVPSLLV